MPVMPSNACLRLASSCLALLGVVGFCPTARAQPSTVEPTPPPAEPAAATRRIGFDGTASFGLAAAAGGALRYEHKVTRWGVVTVRLGGERAIVPAAENNGYDVANLHVGWRRYWGSGYAAVELGPTLLRKRPHGDPFEDTMYPASYRWLPGGRLTVGAKLSGVDLGLSLVGPFLGLGVHLGLDLHTAGG